MGKYNIHNDLKKLENMQMELNPSLLPVINAFLAISMKTKKASKGIRTTKKKISGYKNATIELTIYEPKKIDENAPCLIYLHGGAFILKAATYHKSLICEYALKTPCKVIFVDYRLAGKHPFPTAVEDCYAAFEWTCKNAKALGIDINKIAVGGDSAGGALASAITYMVRDRKAHDICFQMLIYPVTDSRQITESMKKYIDTPVWNAKANQKMWKLYLRNGDYGLLSYASPMQAASFKNMPDAYIEVSEFDCLRDEGIQYAHALQKGGCQVELNETVGTVHGFELAGDNETTANCIKRRVDALKKAFDLHIV